MLTQEQLTILIKLVAQHERTISGIGGAISDHACLIEADLERCRSEEGCISAATVVHVDFGLKLCDKHCAKMIVAAMNPWPEERPQDYLSTSWARLKLSDEDRWTDLPDAVRIRRIQDYVDIVKRNDVVETSMNALQLH